MSGLRGVILGSLALTALEAAVNSNQGARNTGQLFTLASTAVNRLVDPSVPLIPDLRSK